MKITFKTSSTLRRIYAIFYQKMNTRSYITYEGVYKSFTEAGSRLDTQTGYLSDEYLEGETRKVTNIINSKSNLYEGNYRERDLLLLLSGMQCPKTNILDVGSGFGLTYHYLNINLKKNFDYTALDLPIVISIANEIFAQRPNFHSTTFESFQETKYDVVNFGSSLQYFEDYRAVLLRIIANSPSVIFISDTPMAQIDSFVTLQVNMKDRKIPRWVFSFSEINQLLRDHEYELVSFSVVDWHDEIHNFLNFSSQYHHIKNMNLIFKKLNPITPSS